MKKIFFCGYVSLIIVLMMCQSGNTAWEPRLDLSLSGKVNREGPSITLFVSVRNPTKESVSVDISSRTPPFGISIWDEAGQDLYQFAYAHQKKDGRWSVPGSGSRNVTLNLHPGEAKKYEFTVSKVYDLQGNPVQLPLGHYRVETLLAVVKYIDGQYKTKLYHSNSIEITVE